MNRPRWTRLYHFTHIEHLATIVRDGLVADSSAQAGSLRHEAGDRAIKDRRRRLRVPVSPGGVVADYVPFYFAPRSPMLYRIVKGGVPTFDGDQSDLVYLCSTVETFDEQRIPVVVSDRNAAVRLATFSADPDEWRAPGYVDWDLMDEQWWSNTEEDPNRMERRMAECLVHGHVPWSAILAVGTIDEGHAERVREILGAAVDSPKTTVRPEWYY